MSTLITNTTTHTTPIGVCIYCGTLNDLTDEHVIPFSLGGNYVLDKASCHDCAKITSLIERKVTRGFLHEARVAGNMPTRRPKDRPKSLPLKHRHTEDSEPTSTYLPAAEHPGLMHLPLLRGAGVLAGHPYERGLKVEGVETLRFGSDPAATLQRLGSNEMISSVNWDLTAFARMLAKIGYSAAVASCGPLERSRVPLLPFILGTADDASHWLGSAEFTLEVERNKPPHAVGLSLVQDIRDAKHHLLVARIKLFVPSGATGYEVVVLEQASRNN